MWAHLATALVGIWLMAAPGVLGYDAPLATSDRIVGPLIASFGLIAASEVTRSLRWLNVPLAAWLLLSPFLLHGLEVLPHHGLAGLLVGALSLVRGPRGHPFGGGWTSLVKRGQPKLAGPAERLS